MKHVVWVVLTLISAGSLAAAPASPPPGNYRIDGEATTRSGSGPATAERIERWDGATGQRTVITHSGPSGNPGSRQTVAGTGPVMWCVPPPSAPPGGLPGHCDMSWWPREGASTLRAECQAGRLQEHWKQLDAQTWERQMTFTSTAGAGSNDPSGALALAQRGLSPAEAAQARAELAALPGPQATAAAMAPVVAQLEQAVRVGRPEEAAAARQQLAALQAAQLSGAPPSVTTLKERWTRTAASCSPAPRR